MTNAGVRGDSLRGDEAVEMDEVQERTSKCWISTRAVPSRPTTPRAWSGLDASRAAAALAARQEVDHSPLDLLALEHKREVGARAEPVVRRELLCAAIEVQCHPPAPERAER